MSVDRFMPTASPFSETSAVVTGASSGIGRAIAVGLAEAGLSRLVVHYRANRSGAEQTAADAERFGCVCELVSADLASPEQTEQLVETCWQRLETIHTWINNAGADVLTGGAASLSFDHKLRRLMEVDVLGTIGLSRHVAARLSEQDLDRPASMLFIGWDQAFDGMEGDAGQMFGPVKAAVTGYATALAQSLAPQVRVNTVAPGWIQTAWGKSVRGYWDRRARAQSLMRRWGRPEDVARAVCYACDPENTFLSGQTLLCNGGWNRTFTDRSRGERGSP